MVDLSQHTALGQPPTALGLWETLTACDRARGRRRIPGVAVAIKDPQERVNAVTAVAVAAAAEGASVIIAEQPSEMRVLLPSLPEQQACTSMLAAVVRRCQTATASDPGNAVLLVLPSLAFAALPTLRRVLDLLPQASRTYLCAGVNPSDPAAAYVFCTPQDLMVLRTDDAVLLQNDTHEEIVRNPAGG